MVVTVPFYSSVECARVTVDLTVDSHDTSAQCENHCCSTLDKPS